MKKSLTILAVFLFSIQLASAQKVDTVTSPSQRSLYDTYMLKHRSNNTVAWVLLTGGVAVATAGAAIALDNTSNLFSSSYDSHKGEALVYIGLAVSLGSIPFFIGSHSNKKKAKLALKNENITMSGRLQGNLNYPAISLKIDL